MTNRFNRLTPSEAVQKALGLFETNKRVPISDGSDRTLRPALPIVVGAGISVTAGVPLNGQLLKRISEQNGNGKNLSSYEEIYALIKKICADEYSDESFIKSDLRQWLVDAGIPRLKDRPIPNMSNLCLLHLMVHNVIGPIISLNVDPLLQLSTWFYLERLVKPLTFLQNASQFSDLLHAGLPSDKCVYQPHGTIEEPLSLRFLGDELIDRENDIRVGLVNSVKERVGLVALGVNFEDSVAVKLIRGWVEGNPTRKLELLINFHGKVKSRETENLKTLLNKCSRLTVFYAEDVDSDQFLAEMVDVAVEKSAAYRAKSEALYHVPPISEVQAQKLLFDSVAEQLGRGVRAGRPFDPLPDQKRWLCLAIGLLAVSSRGPLSIGELARYCADYRAFSETTDRIENIFEFNNALTKLFRCGILSLFQRDGTEISDVDIVNYDSIDDVEKIMVIRNPKLRGAADFSEVLFKDVLETAPKNFDEICGIIKKIELEREMNFDHRLGMSSFAYFKGSRLVSTHQELDNELDQIKKEFRDAVRRGEAARSMVITESGEHLFQNHILGKIKSAAEVDSSDFRIEEVVRDWVASLMDEAASEDASLSVIVAEADKDWLLEHAERLERDKIIQKLLRMLANHPRIDVTWLPWENHNDHMWLLDRRPQGEAKGVLFPRRHGEQAYFGLRVEGNENVNKLTGVFERHNRDAKPLDVHDVYHVMALTIVDKSSCDESAILPDDRLLMGVRNPDTNQQHKNIACVPTKRIPFNDYREIIGSGFTISSRNESRANLSLDWVDNIDKPGHHSLTDQIENIMARKLGLADALENKLVEFSATPKIVKAGISPIYSSDDVPEHVAMLNVVVFLKKGVEHIKPNTASYSHLSWIGAKDFLDALDENSEGVLSLDGHDGDIPYKCGGICVCTAEAVAQSLSQKA